MPKKDTNRESFRRIVVLPGLVVVTASVVLSTLLIISNRNRLDQVESAFQERVSIRVQEGLRRALIATGGLQAFISSEENVNRENFNAYVANAIGAAPDQHAAVAVAWIDEQGIVRQAYPETDGGQQAQAFYFNDFTELSASIAQAHALRQPVSTKPTQMPQGNPGVAFCMPVFRGDRYVGQAISILNLSDVLQPATVQEQGNARRIVLQIDDRIVPSDSHAVFTTAGQRIADVHGTLVDDSAGKAYSAMAYETAHPFQLASRTWHLLVEKRPATALIWAVVISLSPAILLIVMGISLLYAVWKRQRELETVIAREKTFISVTSHQLRTPLTELSWMLEAAMDAERFPDDLKETAQDMRDIVRSSSKLVGDLLNVSRLERGLLTADMRPVAAAAIIDRALQSLRETASRRGMTLIVDADPDLFIEADAEKAVEVLRNVVDNAIKYGPKNMPVRVETSVSRDRRATISVTDGGTGIPVETQANLFEIASDSNDKKSGSGAGLGLYLSRQFMRLMGGEIGFANAPTGTVFSLTFRQPKKPDLPKSEKRPEEK